MELGRKKSIRYTRVAKGDFANSTAYNTTHGTSPEIKKKKKKECLQLLGSTLDKANQKQSKEVI